MSAATEGKTFAEPANSDDLWEWFESLWPDKVQDKSPSAGLLQSWLSYSKTEDPAMDHTRQWARGLADLFDTFRYALACFDMLRHGLTCFDMLRHASTCFDML